MLDSTHLPLPRWLFYLGSALALLMLVPSTARPAPQGPRDLVDAVDQANRTNDMRRRLTMVIDDGEGHVQTRQATLWRKKIDDHNDKTLIVFSAPGDIAGTALLTHQNPGDDDDQWLFLPALGRVRRVGTRDRRDNFVGTDFTYEDLGSVELDEFDYEERPPERLDGVACRVIVARPNNEKTRKRSAYGDRVSWIDPKRLVVLKTELFDPSGEHVKTLRGEEIERYGRVYLPNRLIMTDLKRGSRTILRFESTETNVGLGDDLFTTRALERGGP